MGHVQAEVMRVLEPSRGLQASSWEEHGPGKGKNPDPHSSWCPPTLTVGGGGQRAQREFDMGPLDVHLEGRTQASSFVTP